MGRASRTKQDGARSRRVGQRRLITLPRVLALGALGTAAALLIAFAPALWIVWQTGTLRYDAVADVPAEDTALVFGAGLQADGTPSALLADRIHAAVLLYRAGKVQRLLMSGDGTALGHDEPAAMALQARGEGVPATAIQRDPGGVHTYASCERAHDLFNVSSAVLVSQSYHLPRAIFTCRGLGIRAVGFSFARVPYSGDVELRAREVVSLDVAWWTLLFRKGPGALN